MVVGGVVSLGVCRNHLVALLERSSHHNGIEIFAETQEQLSAGSECREAPRRPFFHFDQRHGCAADRLKRDTAAGGWLHAKILRREGTIAQPWDHWLAGF